MYFRILGPLEVTLENGCSLPLPPPRYRAAISVLLLHEGTLLPVPKLADAVWGSDMPRDPAGSLRSCVYVLRKKLNIADRLQTQHAGYVLSLREGDLLDLHEFRRGATLGLQAMERGEYGIAVRSLQEATELWRDPPLADMPDCGRGNGAAIAVLEERARVLEALCDSRLALGQHRDVVSMLRDLVASDPLRERYWEQLMLALYRSGNQVEALNAYSRIRQIMNDEYGIDPGPGLRVLHQRMLVADPALHIPASPDAVGPLRRSANARAEDDATAFGPVIRETFAAGVPQELPGTSGHFTGRSEYLGKLTEVLDSARLASLGTVITAALTGTAGVGKTALAVHWAHEASKHFPDGQIYLDLRGFDPGRPVDPAKALIWLLGSLGLPREDTPSDTEARASLYRSMTAKRQMLIILDNVRDAEQVRPLLPGSSTCMTLLTSRSALTGLVARDGVHRLELDVMSLGDATDLLKALIGSRAVAEPVIAEALALRCCRLPLALRIAAELATARPAVPLGMLEAELSGPRGLDLLDRGNDPRSSLRQVFSWSYRQLDPIEARTFRLVSAHLGPEFDSDSAAAVTGMTTKQATRSLDLLARAHMVRRSGQSLYSMYDLLRGYGRDLVSLGAVDAS